MQNVKFLHPIFLGKDPDKGKRNAFRPPARIHSDRHFCVAYAQAVGSSLSKQFSGLHHPVCNTYAKWASALAAAAAHARRGGRPECFVMRLYALRHCRLLHRKIVDAISIFTGHGLQ